MNNKILFPIQRVIRTVLQVVAAIVVFLVGAVPALAIFAPQFLEAVRDILPPAWYAWGLGAVAVIGALAGALARVMAIPGVNAWLTKWGAGSAPSGAKVITDPTSGSVVGLTRKQYRDVFLNGR